MLSPDSKIIVVGAGAFGLSTALWLARSSYTNIIVYDRCAVDKAKYSPSNGCDGASADINKIFGTALGKNKELLDLANEARLEWLAWNKTIENSPSSELPDGITPKCTLFEVCGAYWLAQGPNLSDVHMETLTTMEREAPEWRKQHFIKGDSIEEKRLSNLDSKWLKQFHSLDGLNNGATSGFLDTSGGITIADKACVFARYLCEQAGVTFVLGDPQGEVEHLIIEGQGPGRRVSGIKTKDGLQHGADLVIVASGSWSASIVPEAHRTIEATAGTVLFIDVPKARSDIWEKFHPKNFPSWYFQKGEGENAIDAYGFPITTEGRLKLGFRGLKYTNFQDHPTMTGLYVNIPKVREMYADLKSHKFSRISTPRTKYTRTTINTVPLQGLERMKELVGEAFPELAGIGFTDSRLCWYTDSVDACYVVDYVPGYSNSLFLCSGGSGHGFKLLPVLGKYVKNQIERKSDQFTWLWKWRVVEEGKKCNGLEEGESGPREMSKLRMAAPGDFTFSCKNGSKL